MAAAAVICRRRRSFFEDEGAPFDRAIKRARKSVAAVNNNTYTSDAGVDNTAVYDNKIGESCELSDAEWVELFVKEMVGATSIEDAKSRAAKALENVEKAITARMQEETVKAVKKVEEENAMIKERLDVLSMEGGVLRRAVAIQHEKIKEMEARENVSQNLLTQYQDKVKTLELNNYALSVHLNQALQGSFIAGCYGPNVF